MTEKNRDKGKHRYICSGCGAIAWAKATAYIMCGFCRRQMDEEENK